MTTDQEIFVVMDGLDDRFMAAFANYPDKKFVMVTGKCETPGLDDQALAVLVATTSHIITGYVDAGAEYEHPGEDYEPVDEDDDPDDGDYLDEVIDGTEEERFRKLLAVLEKGMVWSWLIVHDADEYTEDWWIKQGFTSVAPPEGIDPDKAVLVLSRGNLPASPYDILRRERLSWDKDKHRNPEHPPRHPSPRDN